MNNQYFLYSTARIRYARTKHFGGSNLNILTEKDTTLNFKKARNMNLVLLANRLL